MNRCKVYKKVSHVIFDMDGVLLDTERLYTEATQNVVSKYGKTFTWEIKHQLMGLTGTESAKKIVELLELPVTPEEYYKIAQEEYLIIFQNTEIISDTEVFYKKAIASIAGRFGKIYSPEIQSKVIGTPERESSRIAIEEMKIPMSIEAFQTEFRTMSHSYMNHYTPLMPGALKLVKHLHHNKIPLAIATSSSEDSFNLKAKPHKEFFKMFQHIVCGGSDPEVKRGKPHPDIFLVCASRFVNHPKPDDCLVFEDAPNGVKSAKTAGMQVVMIPDENVPEELRTEADIIVKSLDETPLELFGLPPLNKCC